MTRITLPLDDDILDWFRQQVHSAGGGNYLTLINKALKEHIRSRKAQLEETVRPLVQEELSSSRRVGKKARPVSARKAS